MIQTVHKTVHCTRSGRVHRAHTACAVARTRPGSAQHALVARMLGVHWSRHAHAACPRSRPQNSKSRHLISIGQVATSNRCRDQPLILPQKRPCRDPKPCRDTKPPQGSKNHVATSNRCRDTTQATPGCDLKTGS